MRFSRCLLSLLYLAACPLASSAFAGVGCACTSSFASRSRAASIKPCPHRQRQHQHHGGFPSPSPSTHPSALHVSAAAGAVDLAKQGASIFGGATLRRDAKILLLALAAAATLLCRRGNLQTLLWPGTRVGESSSAPLPPGGYGCPFFGTDVYSGTKAYGPFAGLAKLSRKLGSSVFKFYTMGFPVVSVSGADNIKALTKHEFKPGGLSSVLVGEANFGELLGMDHLLYESQSDKHSLLRRIVGSAMSSPAISAAIPSIQEATSFQIDRLLSESGPVQMETVFSDFTLDIAWKQILGLELDDDEVPEFHKYVEDWTKGVMSPILMLPFRLPGLMSLTKAGRGRTYLISKVEEKLQKLDKEGPDSSTISNLYFATDDDGVTKLTREQVIQNALLLIFAGSETSASTLTCASLFLALHPEVWKKIKEEQQGIRTKYGDEFTQQSLEQCVYLDAVIKETLRLKPVEAQEVRKVEETIVVDGKAIPGGWYTLYNIKETHWNDPAVYKSDESHMDVRKGFRPERWLDETTKPSAWIPFGDGRHRCIGERLAMTEMKVFLAILARNVDYELVNSYEDGKIAWKTDTVMARPLDGVEVRASAALA